MVVVHITLCISVYDYVWYSRTICRLIKFSGISIECSVKDCENLTNQTDGAVPG